jgi:electron transfer flavoprotein alpha subunit
MDKYKNIWVFVESDKDQVKKVTLELLHKGKELAKDLNQKVVAVVIGENNENIIKTISLYGAEEIISVTGKEYAEFSIDAYGNVLSKLIEKYSPMAILMSGNNNSKDLSGKLSAKFKIGLVSECVDIFIEENSLVWIRPAFSGKLMTKIKSDRFPQIGTIKAGIFLAGMEDKNNKAKIIEEKIETSPDKIRTKILEIIKDTGIEKESIDKGSIVVSGGNGVGSKENFKIIYDLAKAFGGTVGASKIAVDNDWIEQSHQVGITGTVVRPKIYVACGISGAPAHTAGMKDSEIIIAINTDPKAPIFDIANYGIVGDLFVVIPAIIEELNKIK